jgi:co-chaperonin GroES (HSP10)
MTFDAVKRELKFASVVPMGTRILVRVLPEPELTKGGIIVPAKIRDAWYKMTEMTKRGFVAEVLAVGPQAQPLAEGTLVTFQRAFFVWLYQLADRSLVGTIHEHELIGTVEPDAGDAERYKLGGQEDVALIDC